MYARLSNVVVGFHGCDKQTRDDIVMANPMLI